MKGFYLVKICAFPATLVDMLAIEKIMEKDIPLVGDLSLFFLQVAYGLGILIIAVAVFI